MARSRTTASAPANRTHGGQAETGNGGKPGNPADAARTDRGAGKENGMAPKSAKPVGPVNYRINTVKFLVCREGAVATTRPVLGQPEQVAELARELIPDDAREHFLALYLNAQNRLVASHEVSVGTLSATLVHPREVFGPALRVMGVASIILVHNHPSGDPTPSREDLRLTKQLVEAGKLLDITVHDHVIVGGGGTDAVYASLADQGLL